jgi:ClpA/ClpB-like protein
VSKTTKDLARSAFRNTGAGQLPLSRVGAALGRKESVLLLGSASDGTAHRSLWYGAAAKAEQKWLRAEGRYRARARHQSEILGDGHVGTEHLLLALVAPDETSVAAKALRESGVDYDRLRDAAAARENPARRRRDTSGGTFPPAWYVLEGRAEGFGLALGAKQLNAEHFLLALLWHRSGFHASLLDDLGVSRRTIKNKLAKLGAVVPPGSPPARDDTRWGETFTIRVPGKDAWELASLTLVLLPEGAPFGFNFDRDKTWFTSGQGVDLAPLVRKARRRQIARHRRQEAERA